MRIDLCGKWILTSDYLEKEIPATVPGSIYDELIKNNIMEDPYYRDNEYQSLEYMNHDYEYNRSFHINEEDLDNDIYITFEGIDTLSEIYINDHLVIKTYNMHRTYKILINEYLVSGSNDIKVRLLNTLKYIKEQKEILPYELHENGDTLPNYTLIRKAHCMYGWDWGAILPDAGIWRNCYIDIVDHTLLDEVKILQENDLDKKVSKLYINLKNIYKDETNILVSLYDKDNIVASKKEVSKEVQSFELVVNNPKLWYPVGYGEPYCYKLIIESIYNNEVISKIEKVIGFRNVEVRQVDDEFGKSFTPMFNNIPVFLKGSNYIIEDSILPRRSKENSRYLLESAVYANHNTIRIWGGAIYPEDYFFELCDELGLILWQDLMFACSVYDTKNEFFLNEIKNEITDNVKRFKHHPCLLLICGNNEIEKAVTEWGVPNQELSKELTRFQFEEFIPNILKEIAPEVYYHPSSPTSYDNFGRPDNDAIGDMHYWGVWHGNEPITYYRHYFPRMMSEYGLQSFPTMKTIKTFTKEEDLNIYSYVMECHQKNKSCNSKIMNYTSKMFRYPKDLDNLTYVTQLIQAEGVRYCAEHLRRNYGRCMGSIYWQLNDCWPVASWSSIDYFGRFKALHYSSKRFYQPLLISLEENTDTNEVKVYVHNETLNNFKGSWKYKLYNLNGNIIEEFEKTITINSLSSKEVYQTVLNYSAKELMNLIIKVELCDEQNTKVSENFVTLTPYKHLNLEKPNIKYTLSKKDNIYELKLTSEKVALFVEIDSDKYDFILSDNYFNIYPEEERIITFTTEQEIKLEDIKVRALTSSY